MQKTSLLFAVFFSLTLSAQQSQKDTIEAYGYAKIIIPDTIIDSVLISKGAVVRTSFKDSIVYLYFTTSNKPLDSVYVYTKKKVYKYYYAVKPNDFVGKKLGDFETPEDINKWSTIGHYVTLLDSTLNSNLNGLVLTDIFGNQHKIPENNQSSFLFFTSNGCFPCKVIKNYIEDIKLYYKKQEIDNFYIIYDDSLFIRNDSLFKKDTRKYVLVKEVFVEKLSGEENHYFSSSQYEKLTQILKTNSVPSGVLVNESGEPANTVSGFAVYPEYEKSALKYWLFIHKVHYFHE